MSQGKKLQIRQASGGVINWDPPAKREVVERALSDGLTEPAKIVELGRAYKVELTLDEVRRFIAEIRSL